MNVPSTISSKRRNYRPEGPPPGPFWCTGYAGDENYSIVVAYVDSKDQIKEFWPEAINIDAEPVSEIVFTNRFPKPVWWTPPGTPT
jgi:hypothetical protein